MTKQIATAHPIRPLVLALSLAFPLSSMAATVAAGMSATGYWYDTPVTQNIAATSGPFAETVTFDSRNYDSISTGKSVSDGAGHFASSVSAKHDLVYDPGSVSASTHLSFADSIINTTGSSQAASFGIAINALSFTLNTGWMGTNTASFAARVYVNNAATPVWQTTASLSSLMSSGDETTTFLTGGTSPLLFVGGTATYLDTRQRNSYTYSLASPYISSLALGNVAAGDTLSVRYEIDLFAETYAYGGTAAIDFDDPSELILHGGMGSPIAASLSFANLDPTTPGTVPEPESYALVAAGLGLLAASRRRKQLAS